MIEKGSK